MDAAEDFSPDKIKVEEFDPGQSCEKSVLIKSEQVPETIASPEELPASMKPNNPGLAELKCILETKELWNKFNDLGTEMIITKSGR